MSTVLYILLLVATIVTVDVLFFRIQFWERLTVNAGIVLVFAAFYFRFLKPRSATRFSDLQHPDRRGERLRSTLDARTR